VTLAAILSGSCLLSGCGIVAGTLYLGAAAVGLAGYGTYKAGEGVVSAAGSGASSVGRGVGGLFQDGDYKATEDVPVQELWDASQEAFVRMDFGSPTGNCDALGGEISAWTSDRTTVIVRLESLSPDRTRLVIRVGSAGDKNQSKLIHSYITACLEEITVSYIQELFEAELDYRDAN